MLRATGKSVSYERAFYPIDLSFRWHKVQRIRARIRYTHRSAPKLILLGKPVSLNSINGESHIRKR